jgi:hypothetical protein
MDLPSVPTSPLVVFGPDRIDTSRAEMLVQCLSQWLYSFLTNSSCVQTILDDKIKGKRYKLQKVLNSNEGRSRVSVSYRSLLWTFRSQNARSEVI